MQEKEKAKEHGMRVHIRPLTCCDSDCARVNHCRVGGYQCQVCGMWFCPGNGGNELCEDCWKKKESEEEDGEFYHEANDKRHKGKLIKTDEEDDGGEE